MIRTVLGDIDRGECGNVLMHEHIQTASNDMLAAFGDKWLDESEMEKYAVSVLSKIKEQLRVDVFVDGTSIDLGRNARLLRAVSEKSGVHIVASTGFYYYPSMFSCMRSSKDLAEWILYECENGIEGTDIKPGILKCAADGAMTADMKKRIEAVSMTQAKTGLPMYAHCSHNDTIAYEMIKIFERCHANPEKIILGHASRRLDTDYLESILAQGYYICIDQAFDGMEEKVAQAVYKLCERGYEQKLLFSHDRPLYNDFEAPGRIGLDVPEDNHIKRFSYLQTKLIPAFLRVGCTMKQCEKFLNKNAVDVLNI